MAEASQPWYLKLLAVCNSCIILSKKSCETDLSWYVGHMNQLCSHWMIWSCDTSLKDAWKLSEKPHFLMYKQFKIIQTRPLQAERMRKTALTMKYKISHLPWDKHVITICMRFGGFLNSNYLQIIWCCIVANLSSFISKFVLMSLFPL